MWSVQNMFYGEAEPVSILKEGTKESQSKPSGGDSGRKELENSVFSSMPYYPSYQPDYVPSPSPADYYPDYVPSPPPAKKPEAMKATEQKKETKVVMKVPICCSECEELVENALYALKGVKSVNCDCYIEQVTVVASTAAPGDILKECRRVFKKSRMWTDDDDYY